MPGYKPRAGILLKDYVYYVLTVEISGMAEVSFFRIVVILGAY